MDSDPHGRANALINVNSVNSVNSVNRLTMHPTTAILQADNLSFGYSTPPKSMAFENLSVLLPSGVTLVCGDEGVGKTTLLQLLAGALPTTGQRKSRVCA